MKMSFLLGLVLLLTSCATTMPGKNLALKTSFLGATIAENTDFSNEKVKMYQISIKNYSEDWITIDSSFIGSAPASKVYLGEKMSSWFEACALEKKVSDYNVSLALGSIAAAGIVVGGTSRNSTVSSVGLITATGAIGAAGIRDIMSSKNKAEFLSTLPEGHIFHPFMIPPMKVMQRWILIEKAPGEEPVLTLTTKDKDIGEVSILLAI